MMKLSKAKNYLNKNEKYLLTCSYGPDSMALFHYLVENGYKFEVAHVNYHILKQCMEDEKGVRDACEKNKIKLHILDIHMPEGVNEEAWAREIRYNYFVEVANKRHIKSVLVAHNLGDLIETYIMQKEKGQHLFYGLKYKSKFNGVNIVRPLLDYWKEDLYIYDKENGIDYSIDPSNFDTSYYRNYIRDKLRNYSVEQKTAILDEINQKNSQNSTIFQKFKRFITKNGLKIPRKMLAELDPSLFQLLLIWYLEKIDVRDEITIGRASDILYKLKNKSGCMKEPFKNDYFMYIEYDTLKVQKETRDYSFIMNNQHEHNDIFKFNLESPEFKLIENEFPLEIKPACNAKYYVKNGQKFDVKRYFISTKTPLSLRKCWPGLFNNKNELIYVPRYQKKPSKNGLLKFNVNKLQNL